MRTIKVISEDTTGNIVRRPVYIVNKPSVHVRDNEWVKIVFTDGSSVVVTKYKGCAMYPRCDSCHLHHIDKCTSYEDQGFYVCMFHGIPVKPIEDILEDI